MDYRRGLVAAVVVTMGTLPVTLLPGVAGADSHEELTHAEDDAVHALEHATARERAAAERYAEATEQLPEAEARLSEARRKIDDAAAVMAAAAAEEQAAAEDRAAAEARQEGLQVELERAEDRIRALATATYQGSGMYTVTAVLSATGPQDVINRLGLVDRVAAGEREAMRELAAAQARAGVAREEADQARQRAEDARLAAQGALDAARAAEREAEQAADEVAELVAARAEALVVAEEEREKAEAELARIADELREWEEANRDTAQQLPSGSQLRMPVDGVLTSYYGTRLDPITGEERLHSGVDFAAPGGTPIWAAAAGTVIQAGWNSGYGYFTCLSHGTYEGQGLSTCYAHQSSILVSSGQSVAAGAVIGRVGSTGRSTGDHLHFEVRLAGSPTDPLPWLPDCLC